jgi:hypothetical protein
MADFLSKAIAQTVKKLKLPPEGINLIIGLANDDYEPWLAHIEAG